MSKSKRELRIIYMGTPEFAVAGLQELWVHGYLVVAVITAPDRPAGRGRKLQESEVKKFALQKGIKVLQPTNLKNEDFLADLRALRANLQVVVAFRMLPKVVWQMPEYGTFNLHASLLPQYRGAAPINWAIMNGERETGVTTFFIDEKIDTGHIILQEKVAIHKQDTAGSLHDRLMPIGARAILKTTAQIAEDAVETIPQVNDENLKSAPKIFKDTCQIDWSRDKDKIYNHIRGLNPYPGAWTTLKNGEKEFHVKIYQVNTSSGEAHKLAIGQLILGKKTLGVAVPDGIIEVEELQIMGKKRMKIDEFLNGFMLAENACVY